MTPSRPGRTLGFATGADRPGSRTGEGTMTQERIVEQKAVTESSPAPRETIEKDYVTGAPHGDEEAGGAVGGAVAGAVVCAVVAGPVGAVVGGAVGAAAGTTAGAVDEKAKDNTVVVTREVRR